MVRPEMRALLLVVMAVICTVMSLLYTDLLSFFCPSKSGGDYVFYSDRNDADANVGAFDHILSALQKGSAAAARSDKHLLQQVVSPTPEERQLVDHLTDGHLPSVGNQLDLLSVNITKTASTDEHEARGGASMAIIKMPTTSKAEEDMNAPSSSLLGVAESIGEDGDADGAEAGEAAMAEKSKSSTGCKYDAGKWVKDKRKAPYYSGSSCKRWLSEMWACREMPERRAFEYESYRWQPEGCDMPIFRSQEFLARMRNKVVAFVGDSIGRQQFQSLMCMLTGGDDTASVDDVSAHYGLSKPKWAARADGLAQRFSFTNTTVIYYWSSTLCDVVEVRQPLPYNVTTAGTLTQKYALHLDRPPAFLRKHIAKMDLLVLNTGHHWNRGKMNANGWVMYAGGRPSSGVTLAEARRLALRRLALWLQRKIERRETKAEIYLRTLSPRHFSGGEWDSGGRCDGEGSAEAVESKSVDGRLVRDAVAEAAVDGTAIHLLNITYLSQYRDEAHISKYSRKTLTGGGQDCLHWCLPGVPDVWNELLYAQILAEEVAAAAGVAAQVAAAAAAAA